MTNNNEDKDSKPKLFHLEKTFIKTKSTTKSTIISRAKATWYLNPYMSCYSTNNWSLFVVKIHPKAWDFTTAKDHIIYSKSVDKVRIAFVGRSSIQLKGVAFMLQYKSNLISLYQLQEKKITYQNNSLSMILI